MSLSEPSKSKKTQYKQACQQYTVNQYMQAGHRDRVNQIKGASHKTEDNQLGKACYEKMRRPINESV